MESLVERLFRETYELDEIPDPYGGSPYPLRPSELLNLSSPLVEAVHESGCNPEYSDSELYDWLQDTSHDHSSGLLEATAPAPLLVTETSHDSDLETSQVSQNLTNPNGDNQDEAGCCSSTRCNRYNPRYDDNFRSGEDSPPCMTTTHIQNTLTMGGSEPPQTPSSRLFEQSKELYGDSDAEESSQAHLPHVSPPVPHVTPLNASEPESQTAHVPITQHHPKDRKHILKLLKKSANDGATCLWPCEGDKCGFFSKVDLVKRHIKRVHYRLRPHSCRDCGRRFFSVHTLSIHNNSHTGKKPFSCDVCGRGFSTPSGRSRHRISVHRHDACGHNHTV